MQYGTTAGSRLIGSTEQRMDNTIHAGFFSVYTCGVACDKSLSYKSESNRKGPVFCSSEKNRCVNFFKHASKEGHVRLFAYILAPDGFVITLPVEVSSLAGVAVLYVYF